eukprot:144541_1
MSLLFDKALLSLMDNRTKCSVYGFIRKNSYCLLIQNNHNSFYIIPELVIFICLQYLYAIEYFQFHQVGCRLSKGLQSATSTSTHESTASWNSCFGRRMIESTSNVTVTWDIKVKLSPANEMDSNWYIIGITSNPCDQTDIAFQRNTKDMNYAYYLQNNQAFCKYESKEYGDFAPFKSCQEVIVRMELNLKKQTLSFWLSTDKKWLWFDHKKYQGIMYQNIQRADMVQYTLAVSLYGSDATATIENFQMC